jgi:hypothetical protein
MGPHTLLATAPIRSRTRAALRVVQPPSEVDLVAAEQAAAAFLMALGVDLTPKVWRPPQPGWRAPTPKCSAHALST